MGLVVSQDMTRLARKLRHAPRAIAEMQRSTGEEVAKVALGYYQLTTTGWSWQPLFETTTRTMGDIVTVNVGTRDWKYKMLDETGSKKNYPITPKGPWPLRFQSGFTPKTTPGSLRSNAGGGSFGPKVVAWGVIHPGIEPRGWSKMIRKLLYPRFIPIMKKKYRRVLYHRWDV